MQIDVVNLDVCGFQIYIVQTSFVFFFFFFQAEDGIRDVAVIGVQTCALPISVPSHYLTVRPGARYFHSVRLLQRVKEIDPTIFTKSGIMVGLGEERHEVLQVMDDLRSADVDFLTIGQYLQPTRKHHAVMRYVTPDEFAGYEKVAYTKGFLMVSASPLTRSSHHAGDDFAKLQAARAALAR